MYLKFISHTFHAFLPAPLVCQCLMIVILLNA